MSDLKATVVDLLLVILGDKDAGLPGYLPRVIDGVPHLRECRIGEWVDNYHGPDGAPCSTTCARVRAICHAALDDLRVPAVPPSLNQRPAVPASGRAARRGALPMSRRARAVPGRRLPPSPPARARSSREAV